jgi:hypothetical protein
MTSNPCSAIGFVLPHKYVGPINSAIMLDWKEEQTTVDGLGEEQRMSERHVQIVGQTAAHFAITKNYFLRGPYSFPIFVFRSIRLVQQGS